MKPNCEKSKKQTLEYIGHGFSVTKGMSQLWQEQVLLDYTVFTRDGKQFRAHKAFMSSVSDYFRVMLCGGMLESSKDYVELKGISSTGFGPLLHFIYTGELTLDEDIVQDVLAAASHLQVDSAVSLCADYLENILCLQNCIDIVQTCDVYSLYMLKEKVNAYVIENFSKLVQGGYHCSLTASQLSQYLRSDELKCGTEFGLFNCIRQWLDFDRDSRLKQSAEMMQFVRFPLMLPSDIKEISKTSPEFMQPGSPCKKFLEAATQYHKMKQNDRMALKSSQTTIRNKPALVAFSGDVDDHTNSDSFFILGQDRKWRRLPDLKQTFCHASVSVLENYMYVCGGELNDGTCRRSTDVCYVFDPRFMNWSNIRSMNIGRSHFSLVTCKEAIYAVGGCIAFNTATNTPLNNTDTIEKYSTENDCWVVVGELPHPVRNHAACVLGGNIYISGGLRDDWMASDKFHCFDPQTMQLTELCNLPRVRFRHHMLTLWNKIEDKYCIYIVDSIEGDTYYYSGTLCEWRRLKETKRVVPSHCKLASSDNEGWAYFINGKVEEDEEYIFPVQSETDGVCLGLTMDTTPPTSSMCFQVIERYPEVVRYPHCCMLTLPQQIINEAPFANQSVPDDTDEYDVTLQHF